MWHTPHGDKTFTGPTALVLAYGLNDMVTSMEDGFDLGCEWQFDYRAFDCLTFEQKAWTLRRVAYSLLDGKTPAVELHAFSEAAVANVLKTVEALVEQEMMGEEDAPADEKELYTHVRRALVAVHESEGLGVSTSPDEEVETPLTLECEEREPWLWVIEYLFECILWDLDFTMDEFLDMNPEQAVERKAMLTIADDYFSEIPDDPGTDEARKLLKEVRKLCNRVIRREEKKLGRV